METALIIAVAIVILHILDDLIFMNIGRNIFRRWFGRKAMVAS